MTFCTNSDRKKNIENMAAGTIAIVANAVPRVRFVRIRKGSSGCSARRSISTKTASRSTPVTSDATVQVSPQPYCCWPARERPKTIAIRPNVPVSAPGTSSSPGWLSLSPSTRGASAAAARPIGTLIRKVSRQPSTLIPRMSGCRPVSQPPRIRPTAAPTPDMAAYTENARLRGGPAGNVVAISASAVGDASAAPRPCRPRAPRSSISLWARPPRAEATAKMLTPIMKIRRRP